MKGIMSLASHYGNSSCDPSEGNGCIKMLASTCLAVLVSFTYAFPPQTEIKQAIPVVGDLVADDIKAANDGKVERDKVAEKMIGYVDEAETDAAKWLLLKHAFIQYSKAAEYDKAATVMDSILNEFKDIPPDTALSLIERSCAKISAENAPDLVAIRQWLKMKSRCADVLKSKKATKRQKAEAACLMGDWERGLRLLSVLDGSVGKVATGEKNKSMPVSEIADFWWEYKSYLDTCSAFKSHAVELYRSGIDSGAITGLHKSVAEKRIAELATKATGVSYTRNPYVTRGLVAMWDGEWNVGINKHDDKTLVWKNLGRLGKEYDATRPDVFWQEKSAEFHRGGSCFITPKGLMSKHLKGEWTFEVVFKSTTRHRENRCGIAGHHLNGSVGVILGQSWGGNAGWSLYDSGVGFWTMPGSMMDGKTTYCVSLVGSVSAQKGGTFLNGSRIKEVATPPEKATLTCPDEFYIGRCNHCGGERTFDGQIYCLRIYNRPLKESEIKANNAIDKSRFGIK